MNQFDNFQVRTFGPWRFWEVCWTARLAWTEVLGTATVVWDICHLVRPGVLGSFSQNNQSETEDRIKADLIVVTLPHNLYDYDKRDTPHDERK